MTILEDKIRKLVLSYGVETLLEENDIEEEYVVKLLVDEGLINIDEYFDDGDDEDA